MIYVRQVVSDFLVKRVPGCINAAGVYQFALRIDKRQKAIERDFLLQEGNRLTILKGEVDGRRKDSMASRFLCGDTD